jgi:hypothetical protein
MDKIAQSIVDAIIEDSTEQKVNARMKRYEIVDKEEKTGNLQTSEQLLQTLNIYEEKTRILIDLLNDFHAALITSKYELSVAHKQMENNLQNIKPNK